MAVDVSRIPNNNKFDPVREAILQLQEDIQAEGQIAYDGNITIGKVTGSTITITNGAFSVNQSNDTIISIGIDDSGYYSTSGGEIDGNVDITGNLVVEGNLTVSGATITKLSEEVLIEDNIIVLNSNEEGAPTLDAGIEIERGTSPNVDLLWNETDNRWDLKSVSGARIYNYSTGSTTLTIEAGGTAGDAILAFTPNTGNGGIVRTTNAKDLVFQPNSTTKMVIASGGDVNIYDSLAIGKTAAPDYTLDVEGDGSFTGDVTATTFIGDLTGNADTATNAANATNADTVDLKHATDFNFQYITDNGNTTTNRIILNTGETKGIKMGDAYLRSVGTNSSQKDLIVNAKAMRIGAHDAAWNYDEWAGIAYVHSSKTLYIGGARADNTIWANNAGDTDDSYVNFIGLVNNGLQANGNTVWHAGNDGDGSGLDADTLDTLEATDFTLDYVTGNNSITTNNITVGDISADGLVIDGVSWNSGKVRIEGTSPNIEFRDTDTGSYYWQLGANGKRFYILDDKDRNGTYGNVYPLQLDGEDSTGRLYGERIFADDYHPNADKWTDARTITLGGDLTGNVSIDGSSDVTLSAQVVNDSHTHDGRYYTETETEQIIARSLGWVPAYSTTDENAVFWNESEQAIELYSATDTSIGMALKAVRMKAGDKIRFTTMVKGTFANSDGLYLRLYAYHGDMPDGKTHVSNNATDSVAYVQEDSSGVTNWVENGAITADWVTYEYTYTAPADGYVSLVVLNWVGYSTSRLYVKQPDIQFEKVNDTSSLGGVTASNYLRSDINETMNGQLTMVNAAVPFRFNESGHTGDGQWWRHVLDAGNMRWDVSTAGDGAFTSYSNLLALSNNGTAAFPSGTLSVGGGFGSGALDSNKQGIVIVGTGGQVDAPQDGTERLPTLQFFDAVTNYGSGTATVGELRGGVEWYTSETSSNLPAISGAIYSVNESAYNTQLGLGFYTNANTATPTEKLRIGGAGEVNIVSGDLRMGGTTVINSSRNATFNYASVTNQLDAGTFLMTGVSWNSGDFVISGGSPNIEFRDTETGAYWFQVGANTKSFFVLHDTDKDGNYESTYPLWLNSETSTGQLYGSRIFADNYHPNADKWTTARTVTFSGGDITGSFSIDGSADVSNVNLQVVNDSHTHDGRYYTEEESEKIIAQALGWVPAFSNSNVDTIFWNETEQAVQLYSGTDSTIGMAYKAIRMKAGDKVRLTVMAKSAFASTDGFYLRIYYHNGDLPDGKTHVSHDSGNSSGYVQEDDSSDVSWWENNALGTDWTNFERTYTAPADGYMSLVILNWSGLGTGAIYVKQPDIQFEKVNQATSADDATTLDGNASSYYINTSNIGSQSVNYAAGAGSVGGYTADDLLKSNTDDWTTGKLGIGTSQFVARLNVGGVTTNTSNRSGVALFADANAGGLVDALGLINNATATFGNGVALNFHNASNYSPTGAIRVYQADSGTITDASMRFYTYSGSLTERMRIHPNGNVRFYENVGIGLEPTTANLEVSTNLYVKHPNAEELTFRIDNYGTTGTDAGSLVRLYDQAGNNTVAIDSRSGSTRHTYFNQGGKFGIGTDAPAYELDVNGDINTRSALLVSGSMLVNTSKRSIFLDSFSAGGGEGIFFRNGFTYNCSITAEDHNGSSADGICISGYDGVSFSTGSNSRNEVMRITGGASNIGRVGIGTTTPDHKLHINGNVGVSRASSTTNLNGQVLVYWNSAAPTSSYLYGMDLGYNNSTYRTRIKAPSSADISLSTAPYNSMGSQSDYTDHLVVQGSTGNVGINQLSPSYRLDVNGTIRATGAIYNNSVIVSNGSQTRDKLRVWTSSSYSIGMKNGYTYGHLNNDYAMSFQMNDDSDRGFWWGDTTHTDAQGAMSLTTNGNLTVATSLNVGYGESVTAPPTTYALDVTGTIRATSDIIAFSDARVKENVKTIDNALDKVTQLRGVSYNKIGETEEKIGVIAQEIEKVLPQVVQEDNEGMKSVAYGNIVGVLIEAIKEQQKQIDELKARLDGSTK